MHLLSLPQQMLMLLRETFHRSKVRSSHFAQFSCGAARNIGKNYVCNAARIHVSIMNPYRFSVRPKR